VVFASGLAPLLSPESLLIDMSSARPEDAVAAARALADYGVYYLDAPVSGGPPAALAGTLAIMAGGSEESFAAGEPLLKLLGRPTHVGPAGSGQTVKLVNQMIVATTIAAVAEATILCEAAGIAPQKMRAAIEGGFADSRILQLHGARMEERDFTPGGKSSSQLKDIDNALSFAAGLGMSPPVIGLVHELYRSLCTGDAALLDHSALFLELKRRLNA